jgi:hypothetical protein
MLLRLHVCAGFIVQVMCAIECIGCSSVVVKIGLLWGFVSVVLQAEASR